ncbi:hypothetical protein O3Q51_09530 [Cryomorphaceae bacterium 1068]|nr:hypothetical protein [Cryomorphaceae bacterium 1068]
MSPKVKSTFFKLSEYYFIIMAILAGYTPPLELNPIFMWIALIILVQLIFRNRIMGLVLGSIFFVVNLLFLGALISEFREFAQFTDDAQRLILVGMSIWIGNVIFSIAMIFHYAKKENRSNPLPA